MCEYHVCLHYVWTTISTTIESCPTHIKLAFMWWVLLIFPDKPEISHYQLREWLKSTWNWCLIIMKSLLFYLTGGKTSVLPYVWLTFHLVVHALCPTKNSRKAGWRIPSLSRNSWSPSPGLPHEGRQKWVYGPARQSHLCHHGPWGSWLVAGGSHEVPWKCSSFFWKVGSQHIVLQWGYNWDLFEHGLHMRI